MLFRSDDFDEVVVPTPEGLNLVGLRSSHPELFASFSKDVVPTQRNFVWNFDVSHSNSTSRTALNWDNSYFGINDRELVLFDPATARVVDMKQYSKIEISQETKRLMFIYGDKKYIQEKLDGLLPVIGMPYPNPTDADVFIPFNITEEAGQAFVKIDVYDHLGAHVATLANDTFKPGTYQMGWTNTPGMYLIRTSVGASQHISKIIIR